MPRSKTILQSDYPYHVSARCINKDWFKLPLALVWAIMSDQLYFVHHAFQAQIHAFVLMSNHFHLLISTPLANLDIIMAWFMRETSRSLTYEGNRINQTYGGRYFRSIIRNDLYFSHAYKYIYRNPVDAGLINKVEDYEFSTLNGLLGGSKLIIPVEPDNLLFDDPAENIKWLNELPNKDNLELVRTAIKKKHFKFALDKNTKKASRLEFERL